MKKSIADIVILLLLLRLTKNVCKQMNTYIMQDKNFGDKKQTVFDENNQHFFQKLESDICNVHYHYRN